jgi:hypothetical protein
MAHGRYEVPFLDRPGTVHVVSGRQVKFIKGKFGYAAWLLDRHGNAALPVSTGGNTLNLRKAIAAAERFFERLDSKR